MAKKAARAAYAAEAARLVAMMRYGYPEDEVAAQATKTRQAREAMAR